MAAGDLLGAANKAALLRRRRPLACRDCPAVRPRRAADGGHHLLRPLPQARRLGHLRHHPLDARPRPGAAAGGGRPAAAVEVRLWRGRHGLTAAAAPPMHAQHGADEDNDAEGTCTCI